MSNDVPLEHLKTRPQRLQPALEGPSKPSPLSFPVIRPPKGSSAQQWKYYNYKPLPTPTSIRLLRLEIPKFRRETDLYKPPVCASLIVRDLRDSPRYLALSYTWGDPVTIYESHSQVSTPEDWAAPAFEIICDNQPVSVATNLYTALLSLRCRWDDRATSLSNWLTLPIDTVDDKPQPRLRDCHIWIDALCINQQDLAEKGEQIKLMSKIYSQAYSVCAWLGGDDIYSLSAAEVCRRIAADLNTQKIDPGKWQELQMYGIEDPKTYEKLGIQYIDMEDWLKFYAFINRSWFKRAWIVQEAALARRIFILCGFWNMTTSAIFDAISFLSGSSWINQIKVAAENRIQDHNEPHLKKCETTTSAKLSLCRSRPLPPFNQNIFIEVMNTHFRVTGRLTWADFQPLGTILERYRGTLAGDPRDKVYAFLGMAKEFQGRKEASARPSFTPDYTKSITDVYIDVMKYILTSSENLLFLGLKEPRTHSPADELPSWVPDFRTWPVSETFVLPGQEPWAAFGSVKPKRFEFVGERSFKLTGQRVCRVVEVSLEQFQIQEFQDALPILSRLPEYSECRDPILNISIIQFHNVPRGGSAAETKPVKERLRRLRETHTGEVRLQSRYEVLWRTLLYNTWSFWRFGGLPRSYPAPNELGELLACHILESINSQQVFVGLAFLRKIKVPLDGLLPEGEEWKRLITLYAARSETRRLKLGEVIADSKDVNVSSALEFALELKTYGKMVAAWHKLKGEMCWDDDELVIPPSLAQFITKMKDGESSDDLRREVTKSFLEKSMLTTFMPTSNQSDLSPLLKKQVYQTIQATTEHRRIFATDTMRLGLGPKSVEVGDEVWIMESGAMPLIMRPVGDDGEYALVGEAYVHGIMHGEAVSEGKVEEICLI